MAESSAAFLKFNFHKEKMETYHMYNNQWIIKELTISPGCTVTWNRITKEEIKNKIMSQVE